MGGPIIKTIVFLGLYWGLLYFGKLSFVVGGGGCGFAIGEVENLRLKGRAAEVWEIHNKMSD